MKAYAALQDVPTPVVDYRNFNHDKMLADETEYKAKVKARLIEMGYTGKLTGTEYNIPHADSHAQYMVAEKGSTCILVHLPLCDAWHAPAATLRGTRRQDILNQIRMNEAWERARSQKG
jgi:hypothetical protein